MWAVIKKEFKSYFYTPIGYIFIGVFLIAFSISFYLSVIGYGNVNFEYIYYTLPTILVLAFIIPLLTMRSFSEERKTGTEQLLLTSPISITKIVLGKFIAALFIVLLTELCTFMYFGILCHYGMPKLATTFATLFGFLLFVMSYISFGMLTSSITENQIISGIISIGFFIITWVLPEYNSSLESYSFINMFYKYTQGQIDIGDSVTFLTFTITCILLTITVMQRRKSVK
ncbi:MAG: ABC transporter permease subunit [Clostridia bacterium]|nr:ABC transporter permease subunit [Clostridia bacterium]